MAILQNAFVDMITSREKWQDIVNLKGPGRSSRHPFPLRVGLEKNLGIAIPCETPGQQANACGGGVDVYGLIATGGLEFVAE